METKADLIAAVKEHARKRLDPDQLGIGTERVDLKLSGHLKVEASKRQFRWIVGEPPERGGGDDGPNPLAYFLSGAASCLMMQYAILAIARDIAMDDLGITARAHYDLSLGGSFTEALYDVKIESRESQETIKKLAGDAERLCFAHNTFKRAGMNLMTNLFLNGKKV